MKVCFETFGCRLNKAEALQQEAEYLAKGWQLTTKHSEADLFVVRGCSVTARAQYECEKLINHLRRHYPTRQLLVEGCLKEAAKAKVRIPEIVRRRTTAATNAAAQSVPTRTARAYLKVQDGCSGRCTFCIVPQFRGKSRSESFDALLERARNFIAAGYHEIVVTGCNLSLYADQGRRLPELLAALAELSPDCRIRLGSLEPSSVAEACLEVMSAHANCCRFLHLPIQSGSERLLQKMARPYSIWEVEKLLDLAQEKLPDLGLGCDLMCGFPGESELDHAATRGLFERHPFTLAHIFPYSERPGTTAVALSGAVPKNIRTARAHELSRLMNEKRRAFARKFIGQTVEVVVESESELTGWTSQYLPFKGIGKAPRKALVRVLVTEYRHGKLRGKLNART